MKNSVVILFVLAIFCQAQGQKKLITLETYSEWQKQPKLQDYGISDDGKYVWYRCGDKLTISTAAGKVLREVKSTINPVMLPENVILFESGGHITKLNLKTKSVNTLDVVNINRLEPVADRKNVFAASADKKLFLLDTRSGKIITLGQDVDEFNLNEQKTSMVFRQKDQLVIADLKSGETNTNSSGDGVDFGSIKFDAAGKRCVFSIRKSVGSNPEKTQVAWYYYKPGMQAPALIDAKENPVLNNYDLSRAEMRFTADGEHLLAKVASSSEPPPATPYKGFWHYQQQRYVDEFPEAALFAISISGERPVARKLEEGRLELLGSKPAKKFLLIKKHFANYDDLYWNEDLRPEFSLIDLTSGIKKAVLTKDVAAIAPRFPFLSPSEKYIYWFDYQEKEYITYSTKSGSTTNVTKNINVPADLKDMREGSMPRKIQNIEDWVGEDEWMIFRDKYDLWQADPSGQKPPINLTDGYGRKNNIEFVAANSRWDPTTGLPTDAEITLRAMSNTTKDNGFCRIKLGRINQLNNEHLKPCLFSWMMIGEPKPIMKAKKADVYLVTRQSATEAPNLCITSDLKSYTKLTDIAPQKEYNWMTSELVTYPLRSGKTGQAILFKPENFDPSKKYAVIFNYYEWRTFELHKFRDPELFAANVDVATYVSNGYLICMPDINNDVPGKISQTVVDAVESAVDYLSRYTWFDTARMGLQGQSFGGYETNILVANSNRFAAASSMAGISNTFSGYFGKAFGERSATWIYEEGQFNLHTTPWDNIQAFIENSPVLQANKVTTPLLILHNRDDGAVPFNQGYEMFYALRRLKKPVWLYEYEGGHTSPGGEESNRDFAIRLQEFFDHYLKGKPAPRWISSQATSKNSISLK